MKILITFVPLPLQSLITNSIQLPTPSIYLLGRILTLSGFDVKILDPLNLSESALEDDSTGLLKKDFQDIDVFALSANSYNWSGTKKMIGQIRQINPRAIIVLGGIHPSFFDTYVLVETDANIVIRGEGEERLPALLLRLQKQTDWTNLPGLTYKNSQGEICRTPDAPPLNLESYNQYPYDIYTPLPAGVYTAPSCETSRGCPYRCSFCGIMFNHNWRGLTAGNAMQRIRYSLKIAREKFIHKLVFLSDDCFTADKSRTLEIFEQIGKIEDDFKIILEGRLNNIRDESVMAAIPVQQIQKFLLGVECGYDAGLKKIKKGYTVSEIEDIIAWCYKKGKNKIIECSFIIGFPWETENECIKTIQFAARLVERYKVQSSISWWNLIPSDLWLERHKYGINVGNDYFDDPHWFSHDPVDMTVFYATHPVLTDKAYTKIQNIIRYYYIRGIRLSEQIR